MENMKTPVHYYRVILFFFLSSSVHFILCVHCVNDVIYVENEFVSFKLTECNEFFFFQFHFQNDFFLFFLHLILILFSFQTDFLHFVLFCYNIFLHLINGSLSIFLELFQFHFIGSCLHQITFPKTTYSINNSFGFAIPNGISIIFDSDSLKLNKSFKSN